MSSVQPSSNSFLVSSVTLTSVTSNSTSKEPEKTVWGGSSSSSASVDAMPIVSASIQHSRSDPHLVLLATSSHAISSNRLASANWKALPSSSLFPSPAAGQALLPDAAPLISIDAAPPILPLVPDAVELLPDAAVVAKCPLIDILFRTVIMQKITEYLPGVVLLSLNRASQTCTSTIIGQIIYHRFLAPSGLLQPAHVPHFQKNGRSDYQFIGQNLSRYSEMIRKEYEKQVSLFKNEDYTARRMRQTVPFGIFPTNALYYLSQIDWHWSALIEKQTEFNSHFIGYHPSFKLNAFQHVRYFFSLPPTTDAEVREAHKQMYAKTTLARHDPACLNRFFRYLFDQIHCSAKKTAIYDEELYSLAISLFKKPWERHLLYEDLHYALLVHVHTILTTTFVKNNKLKLIAAILKKIKSKKIDLTNLREQLQYLLSPAQQAERMAKIPSDKTSLHANDYQKIFKTVLNIMKKHFPNNASKASSRCVIS